MKINVKELVIFSMLGATMYASKMLMEVLPNIHLLGAFIVAITVVYRAKALYPLYVYVFLNGLLAGFPMWWVPYLYVWAVLWGMVMLLPKNIPWKIAPIVYMVTSSLHGFLFGVLCAPSQAIMFGLDWQGMIAWIVAGAPFDITHGISNFFCGALITPLIMVLRYAKKYAQNN